MRADGGRSIVIGAQSEPATAPLRRHRLIPPDAACAVASTAGGKRWLVGCANTVISRKSSEAARAVTGFRYLLTAQGVGPLTLPLSSETSAALASVAQPAPYGYGSGTLVDPAVRRCVQLEPAQLSLQNEEAWGAELWRVVAAAAEGLGLPSQAVQVGAC